MLISLVIGFVLGALAIVFALENRAPASLSFFGRQFEASLAIIVLLSLATGILVSILVALPSSIAASVRMMSLRRENRKLAEKVEEVRREAPTVVVAQPDEVVDLR